MSHWTLYVIACFVASLGTAIAAGPGFTVRWAAGAACVVVGLAMAKAAGRREMRRP